jgi:hypothetical protein
MIDYNSEVATQNIYMDKNMVCRTEREILAGEQLGFDYGDKYWNAVSSRPMFFLQSCSSSILQCDAETCTQPGIWRCKKCKKKWYCSEACQREDWGAGHNKGCQQKCHSLKCSKPIPQRFFPCPEPFKCVIRYCSEACQQKDRFVHRKDCLPKVPCSSSHCRNPAHEWYSCCKKMRFCGGHCYRAGLKLNPGHQCDATLRKRTQFLTADF